MEEYAIISGNPVLNVLALTLEGEEFEVVDYDGRREKEDQGADGERRS